MKASELLILFFVIISLFVSTVILAGTDIFKTTAPVPSMYTLTDIYNLIHENNNTPGTHTLSTTTTPIATSSYSVSQLYADLANLIKRENLETGVKYLGVTGDFNNADPAYSTTTVIASSLTPSGTAGDSTGYSLEDIWNLIDQNATTTPGTHANTPSTGPASSMHSLADIYNELNTLANNKKTSVKSGEIYLGQTGSYVDPCPTLPSGFSGGDGSIGSPYQICKWTQLDNMRNYLTSSFILTADLNSSSPGYDGLGDDWQPVGYLDNEQVTDTAFNGNFDGDGYTISGLVINLPTHPTRSVGLFGNTWASGTIKDVGLINVNITGDQDVGALVGRTRSTTITNCYSTGAVSGTSNTSSGYIGGLVGSAYFHPNNTTISNSYSSADISAPGASAAGGLTGENYGSITNSYATGSVTGGQYTGGLVGQLVGGHAGAGGITNSYSTGRVADGATQGGLVGKVFSGGASANSFWDIDTSFQGTSASGVGTTTIAMKTESTFTDVGWDFGVIWQMLIGAYPTLR